jgi:hypothetical protein
VNANYKRSMAWAILLVLLGLAAVYGGTRWLMLLIPLAILVWIGAKPALRGDRN